MSLINWKIEYFVLLLPFLAGSLFFIWRYYFLVKKFNISPLVGMRNYHYSRLFIVLRSILLVLSVVFLAVAILRPVWGEKKSITEAKGIDVVFTLDVSQSMKALDLSQNGTTISRLQAAKRMIADFVEKHPQNRYGLVIFAGEAFVSTPLTIDQSAFLTFLSGVDYNDVGKQGTDLGQALKASIDRFYSEQDKERGRLIILISDGGEKMTDKVEGFAKVAHKLNIGVFSVGVGNTKGVPIPESRDFFGNVSYKKFKGHTVMTKLNEDTLKKIAQETRGEYFHAQKKSDLKKIEKKLAGFKATTIKSKNQSMSEDQYQFFLLPSFVFFVLFLFFDPRILSGNLIRRFFLFVKQYYKLFFLLPFVFVVAGCSNSAVGFRYYNSLGNRKFAKEFYIEAQSDYRQAGENSHKLKYISDNNSALAYYNLEKYEQAIKKLEQDVFVYCDKDPKKYCDQLYYNLGDAYYRLGEQKSDNEQVKLWQQAVAVFKKDLAINKDDKDAQENIDFILDKLKKSEQKQKNKEQKNKSANNKFNQNRNSEESGKNSEQRDKKRGETDNKDSQDGQDKTAEQSVQGNKNDKKSQDQSEQNKAGGEEKNQSDASDADNLSKFSGLDSKTNKQVDNYLQKLQEQEKNNQDYFRSNPNGLNNNNTFDDFFNNPIFNDPFFKSFFNNSQIENGFNQQKSNDGIDW